MTLEDTQTAGFYLIRLASQGLSIKHFFEHETPSRERSHFPIDLELILHIDTIKKNVAYESAIEILNDVSEEMNAKNNVRQ